MYLSPALPPLRRQPIANGDEFAVRREAWIVQIDLVRLQNWSPRTLSDLGCLQLSISEMWGRIEDASELTTVRRHSARRAPRKRSFGHHGAGGKIPHLD